MIRNLDIWLTKEENRVFIDFIVKEREVNKWQCQTWLEANFYYRKRLLHLNEQQIEFCDKFFVVDFQHFLKLLDVAIGKVSLE